MSSNQKKYHNQIDAYFRNELSDKERSSFEKLLQEDNELLQEFIVHKELYAQFDSNQKIDVSSYTDHQEVKSLETYFRSDEAQALKDVIDIVILNHRKKVAPKHSNRNVFIALVAAASVALFVILYTMSGDTTQELYASYSTWQELPSLTSRNDGSQLSIGQSLFEEGKYEQANDIFKSFTVAKKEVLPSVFIYAGVSALEINKYEEAISYFDQLINSDTIDRSKGYWYKALVYLKQGKKKKAVKVLEMIVMNKNNFNFKEASELLDKLK